MNASAKAIGSLWAILESLTKKLGSVFEGRVLLGGRFPAKHA